MEQSHNQGVPEDIASLNSRFLHTALEHYVQFATNEKVRMMLANTDNHFARAAKKDDKVQMMRLNQGITQLEEGINKPLPTNNREQEAQMLERSIHFRLCMEQLMAHFAVATVWNDAKGNPWAESLMLEAADYLESNVGMKESGKAYCDFIKRHNFGMQVEKGYIITVKAAAELLRERIHQ